MSSDINNLDGIDKEKLMAKVASITELLKTGNEPRTPAPPDFMEYIPLRRLPTGYLFCVHTERVHPISFRLSPFPGGQELPSGHRWKSVGHHAEGFASFEEAREWVLNGNRCLEIPALWLWDGTTEMAVMSVILSKVIADAAIMGEALPYEKLKDCLLL